MEEAPCNVQCFIYFATENRLTVVNSMVHQYCKVWKLLQLLITIIEPNFPQCRPDIGSPVSGVPKIISAGNAEGTQSLSTPSSAVVSSLRF